jgi:hypothetical protein
VTTQFAVQLPMQSRGQVVKDLALEVESGFISRKRAILKLNPELKEQDVMGIMKEIDEERVAHGMAEDEPGNPEGSETSTESTTS